MSGTDWLLVASALIAGLVVLLVLALVVLGGIVLWSVGRQAWANVRRPGDGE